MMESIVLLQGYLQIVTGLPLLALPPPRDPLVLNIFSEPLDLLLDLFVLFAFEFLGYVLRHSGSH